MPLGLYNSAQVCSRVVLNEPEVLNSTDLGQAIYNRLLFSVQKDADLPQILFTNPPLDITLGQVIGAIRQDELRIRSDLNDIISSLPENSPYRVLLERSLHQMNEQKPDCSACANKYNLPFAQLINANSPVRDSVRRYIAELWGTNRSFVAEAITAFEFKGVLGTSLRLEQIIPRRSLELFRTRLRQAGLARLLNMEIDIVVRKPNNSGWVWVEVKSPLFRKVETADDQRLNTVYNKKADIDEFLSFVRSDPRLAGAMNTNIDFAVVYRGQGVSQAVINHLAGRGITAYDRSRTFGAITGQ